MENKYAYYHIITPVLGQNCQTMPLIFVPAKYSPVSQFRPNANNQSVAIHPEVCPFAVHKTLREHARDYLDDLIKYRRKKPLTIKAESDAFNYNFYGTSLFKELDTLGIVYPEDVTYDNTYQVYCRLEQLIKKINYRTSRVAPYRHLLKYLMNKGIITRNDDLLKLLKTERWLPAKPALPSEVQIKLLEEWAFSKQTFACYRDTLMICVLVGICGLRPGQEVAIVKFKRIDYDKCEIIILRKSGKEKPIKFPRWVRPYLKKYMEMRAKLMGPDAETVPYLFVKHSPKMGRKGNDPYWAISKFVFWQRVRTLKKIYPILQDLKPYFLRHLAITVHAYNATEEGISIDELAYLMDNSSRVLMTFYHGKPGRIHELLSLKPHEKIAFLKARERESLEKFHKNPENDEHLYSALSWKLRIGRAQNNIDLDEYEMRDNDFPDLEKLENQSSPQMSLGKLKEIVSSLGLELNKGRDKSDTVNPINVEQLTCHNNPFYNNLCRDNSE